MRWRFRLAHEDRCRRRMVHVIFGFPRLGCVDDARSLYISIYLSSSYEFTTLLPPCTHTLYSLTPYTVAISIHDPINSILHNAGQLLIAVMVAISNYLYKGVCLALLTIYCKLKRPLPHNLSCHNTPLTGPISRVPVVFPPVVLAQTIPQRLKGEPCASSIECIENDVFCSPDDGLCGGKRAQCEWDVLNPRFGPSEHCFSGEPLTLLASPSDCSPVILSSFV
jgi:hypothetical protein